MQHPQGATSGRFPCVDGDEEYERYTVSEATGAQELIRWYRQRQLRSFSTQGGMQILGLGPVIFRLFNKEDLAGL